MSSGDASKFTPAKWAQRRPVVFLTFCVEDCKHTKVTYEANKVIFEGQGGSGNKKYNSELELYKEIVPENSKWVQTEREVICTIAKKETDEEYWPRLLKEKVKQHWLKVDFSKWNDDEDSSDEDQMQGGGQPDLSEMMAQMGRGAGGDIPDSDSEEDSDDEDLPGLENAQPEPEEAPKESGPSGETMEAQACDA